LLPILAIPVLTHSFHSSAPSHNHSRSPALFDIPEALIILYTRLIHTIGNYVVLNSDITSSGFLLVAMRLTTNKNMSPQRQRPCTRVNYCWHNLLWLVGALQIFANNNHHVHVHSFVVSPSRSIFGARQQHEQDRIITSNHFYSLSSLYAMAKDDHFVIGGIDTSLSRERVESLTVPQIKQQLRLRGLAVSGRKSELTDRLLQFSAIFEKETTQDTVEIVEPEILSRDQTSSTTSQPPSSDSKARQFAKERGKELIDVTAYVDDADKDKSVKSSTDDDDDLDGEDDDESSSSSSGPETWGSEAKIVDDYEGRSPIVDGMARTIIEYKGSNQTYVQAYVVASRDALRPFLEGGTNRTAGSAEDQLQEIQVKREKAAKRPMRFEEVEGLDEGDETGLYEHILDRDFTDWGKYTLTGAQLSAQEVQGVLLLSDVSGISDDMKALAEKIAFECQPIVVMVPDLFRGKPWKEDLTTPGFNDEGLDYEQWRGTHSDVRVNVDIRAAAASLREQFGVSCLVVWGACYGGGRALEIGAGYLPEGKVHDIDGSVGPVPVDPSVVVAWYPARYNAKELFGVDRITTGASDKPAMAVMAVFAGNDKIPGATTNDAAELRSCLEADERVKDLLVKVFPGQDHGFAHMGLGQPQLDDGSEFDRFVNEEFGGSGRVSIMDGGDAEVACLLSTAFMETYSRVFLPTAGPPISKDDGEQEWSKNLEMKDYANGAKARDVRQEIEDSLENFVEEPHGGSRIDPNDGLQGGELATLLRSMEPEGYDGPFKIVDDDDVQTMFAKLTSADPEFQIF
jgi:dienelactone hydrolase